MGWGLTFIDDNCDILASCLCPYGIQPGIHKVSHLLCITMSKTFSALEWMPCSHISTPLTPGPYRTHETWSPQKNSTCKVLMCVLDHTLGRATCCRSFPSYVVLQCKIGCEWQKVRTTWRYTFLMLPKIRKIHVGLCKFIDCQESQWLSSEHYMLGHIMTLRGAHSRM